MAITPVNCPSLHFSLILCLQIENQFSGAATSIVKVLQAGILKPGTSVTMSLWHTCTSVFVCVSAHNTLTYLWQKTWLTYMLYTNHGKEVYMVNILPETEVRGSLQQIYPEPQARGISNCKLPMTKVEGSIFVIYTSLPWFYNIYYTAWVDYVSGSASSYIAFLNFESTRLVCCCVLLLLFDWKRMSLGH